MISVCEFMNSYWSSREMTTSISPTSLLTRDLEVRSAGSSGRRLLELLELYCLDLLGTSRPLEFARRLQSADPRCRQVLEELLEWTGAEQDFQLVALVAFSPELDRIARSMSRRRPTDDTVSEILAQATQALRRTHELVEGERIEFVLSQARRGLRGERRKLTRHNVPAERLPIGFDQAEAERETEDYRLEVAVARHVITPDERRLISETRSGENTLEEFAASISSSYDSCRMRRARAECRVREYFDVAEVAK